MAKKVTTIGVLTSGGDAPQSRFLGSRILDVSIDDLAVSAVGAVNRRI